jgi:hypothetical protein
MFPLKLTEECEILGKTRAPQKAKEELGKASGEGKGNCHLPCVHDTTWLAGRQTSGSNPIAHKKFTPISVFRVLDD